MPTIVKKLDAGAYQLKDQVVAINRVTKVVKGGKNLSFAALVVVGDPTAAVVGYGSGKAKEVPQAIRKGIESAKKNLVRVNLTPTTIPHAVLGRFGSGMVKVICCSFLSLKIVSPALLDVRARSRRVKSLQSFTFEPLIFTITSPARMPALAAAEPGATLPTSAFVP